ncbi:MAG: carboxymuconolactone decarboxylase family protein [Desulfobacterales bacterium]|nr:carboxymuconolactone decarboxylase family protein [Desulfobacterales bacterium]
MDTFTPCHVGLSGRPVNPNSAQKVVPFFSVVPSCGVKTVLCNHQPKEEKMDPKTEILIALGTAIGANCIPCFDHLYSRSREVKLTDEEIRAVAALAGKVKNGATVFMQNNIAETLGDAPSKNTPAAVRPRPAAVEMKPNEPNLMPLIDRYHDRLKRFVQVTVRDTWATDDIVQDFLAGRADGQHPAQCATSRISKARERRPGPKDAFFWMGTR